MRPLTKDQMQLLTPEEIQALAVTEAGRAKRRARLVEQAKSYKGQFWVGAVALGAMQLSIISSREYLPFLWVVTISWVLIYFHAIGLNRRLDALLELIDEDNKDRNYEPPQPIRKG